MVPALSRWPACAKLTRWTPVPARDKFVVPTDDKVGCVPSREVVLADSIYFDIGRSVLATAGAWYRDHQLLGVGGNAVTYLVFATSGRHKGVPFALKIFRKLSRQERRDAFLTEVEFLEGCYHPAVIRTFDLGTLKFSFVRVADEYPFVVAEYLPTTLCNLVERSGSASISTPF